MQHKGDPFWISDFSICTETEDYMIIEQKTQVDTRGI